MKWDEQQQMYRCDEEEMIEFDRAMEQFIDLYEEKTGQAERLFEGKVKK